MSDASLWDDIAIPGTDLNVRQAAGNMAVPCFWGRDANGACLFVIELEGNHTAQYRKHVVTVNGIDVDLRAGKSGQQRLILTLEKQVDRDLFESLCRTLASALQYASDSSSSLAVALAHIRRWKTFLSGRGGQRLSVEEVRGLFAELMFLLELMDRLQSTGTAVEAWLGPERSHQDFIFGNTAIEIKSLSGAERSTVRISSEDQLESLNDNLFLRVYRLSNLQEASSAQSLNEVVSAVQARLGDAKAVEAFDRKLVANGYAPLPDYDEPRFVVSEVRSFRVEESFPCLIRSRLPTGVAKVAYDIRLEAIASFTCDNGAIYGGTDGTDG
jgi:hypothetical protein